MSCKKETQISDSLLRRFGSPCQEFDVQEIYHQLNDLADLNVPKNKSEIIDHQNIRLFVPVNTEYSKIFSNEQQIVKAHDFVINTNDQTGVINYSRLDEFGQEKETNKILFRFNEQGKVLEFDAFKQNGDTWSIAATDITAKKIVLAIQSAMFHGLLKEKLVFKRPIASPSPAQTMANYYRAYQQEPSLQSQPAGKKTINLET